MVDLAVKDLRNRLVGNARFRDSAQKIPLIQLLASHQANELFQLCSGFIHSQVLLACVRLELFGRLADGPVDSGSLYAELDLDQEAGERLFAAAAALELLEWRPSGRVALGRLGAALNDNPGVIAMIRHHALLYEDLRRPDALFSGKLDRTRMGELWAYAGDPGASDLDARAVGDYSQLMAVSQAMVAEQILTSFSLRGVRTLLDIGGGAGAFALAAARRWPRLDVSIVDLPQVADIARARVLEAGLERRVDVFGADATADFLPDGFDVVSLVRILHDHGDERSLGLLRAAHRALRPGGTLLIAEPMAGDSRAGRLVSAYFNVYLLAMGSGKPRTPAALARLAREAGFRRIRRRRTSVPTIASILLASR